MIGSSGGRWSIVAGVAVSAALLAVVFYQIDRIDFAATLGRLGPAAFAAAVAGCLLAFLAVSWRFGRAVGRLIGEPVGLADTVRLYLPIVLATSLLAYGISVGSEVARLLFLKHRHGLDIQTGIGVLVADRLVGFGIALLLAVPSAILVFWPAALRVRLLTLAAALATTCLVLAIVVLVMRRLAVLARLAALRAIMSAYLGRLPLAGEQLLIGAAATCGLALAVYGVSRGIGASIPFGIALAAAPIVYIGASVPFTYAGWGSREITCIATLAWTGWMTTADALALSVTLGIAAFVASLPGLIAVRLRTRR